MMTRRQRLTATLEGRPVDRPAVNFYEIGGWNVLVACDDPDEFNVYNDPSWRPLAQLAEEKTDIIRMVGPIWKGRSRRHPAAIAQSDRAVGATRSETWREGRSSFTRMVVAAPGRDLTSVTRRDPETMTTWTIEHLLKSVEDVKAYLQLPEAPFEGDLDVEAMEAGERELGEAGIFMIDTGDPLCEVAGLFSMADYTVLAMTEGALFHRLLARSAAVLRYLLPTTSICVIGMIFAHTIPIETRLWG